MPGAAALLREIAARNVPHLICTGSPRAMAELLVKESGLDAFVDPARLVCNGDEQLEGATKADARYWRGLLGTVDPARVIGFDDHPHSARCLLEAGRIGRVAAAPSVPRSDFAALECEFPGRVFLIEGLPQLFTDSDLPRR
jgi:beta-phosphoglucomutase-like phosphatase (HAD superfamily)